MKNFRTMTIPFSLVILFLFVGLVSVSAQNPQADIAFLNAWASDTQKILPFPAGDVTLSSALAYCPAGCMFSDRQPHLRIVGMTTATGKRQRMKEMEALTPFLLNRYCTSGADKRNIKLLVDIRDRSLQPQTFWITPSDCPHISTPEEIAFLNGWAAKVQQTFPMPAGEVTLTSALPYCASGCTYTDPKAHLRIIGSTPRLIGRQRNRAALALKPFLMNNYCTSGAAQNHVEVLVDIRDRNFKNPFTFAIKPGDCPASATPVNLQTPMLPATNSAPNTVIPVQNRGQNPSFQTQNTVPNPVIPASNPVPPAAPRDEDDSFWDIIKNSTRPKDFQNYLRKFPNGRHAAEARAKIN